MSVNDITKYKKAIIYVKELSKINEIMSESVKKLESYKKFIPVQECLDVLSTNQKLVEVHLKHQKKIVETKGKDVKS